MAGESVKRLKSYCPICGKEYEYLPNYKPNTCGEFACIIALANKRTQEFADVWNRMKKRS